MRRNAIGLALSAMNRFAGSELADRFRLRKPVEKLAYLSTRTGFQVISSAAREWQRVERLLPTSRLPKAGPKELFDLSLNDEQQMIVDSLQRLAREALRPAAGDADERNQIPETLWQQSEELGLTHYAVPEAFGGVAQQQSPMSSVLMAETLAWGDMGLACALLAPYSVAQAISRWGNGAQQSLLLPAFAGSQPPLAALAIDEPVALFDPSRLQTSAWPEGEGFVLQGTKNGVVMAEAAEFLLVAASLEDIGPRLFFVERGLPGLKVSANPGMGLRAAALGRVDFDKVRLGRDALIGESADFDYQEMLDLAGLMRCGLAIGTCQAVLDYVIPYCNDRKAFGEPISHRQSVAFAIADMAIEIDAMRLLTWRAASRAEQGLPFHREAYLARLLCDAKAMEIGSWGVQLLGGHGFVKEHPVERWYRDLRSVAVMQGGLHA